MKTSVFILSILIFNVNTIFAQYCTSYGNTVYNTSTTRVVFNTIDNSSGKPSGYSDYTSISTSVNAGAAYNLTVQVNTDGNYTIHSMVWIDWNQDGDFDDTGESYDLGTATDVSNGPTSNSPLSVTIPITATSGSTRMRVSSKYNAAPTSCETDFDGEVEDYTINVITSGSVTFYNTAATTGYTYFDNTRASATPRFTISATNNFDAINFEINTADDFTGTSYTQTITGLTGTSGTHYDLLCDNLSPVLPSTNGAVYYVRARASNDGGSTWGNWSTQQWSFTHDIANYGWFQTAQKQFEEGTLTGNFIHNTTNGTPADYLYMDRGSFDLRSYEGGIKECSDWYPSTSVDYMTIGYQDANCNGPIYTGTRFLNFPVPKNASILSADYTLYESSDCPSRDNGATIQVTLEAEAIDNAPAATSSIDAYPTTSATQNWVFTYSNSPGTARSETTTNIIQELINRTGWIENNDILLMTESTSDPDNGCVYQGSHSSYQPRLQGVFTDFENYWLSPAIEFASLACTPNYQQLVWDADETYGSIKIQLYYDNGGTPTIIPDAALPGNSSGFTTSPVDISGLNSSIYSRLYIRAILRYTSSNTNQSPKLNSWGITADPVASVDLGTDQTICPSSSITINASGCGAYQWSTGETSASITVSPASTTTYTVTATVGNGDTDTDTITITVAQPVDASTSGSTTICNGDNVTINASGSTSYTWSASPADASLSGQENNSSITVSPSTTTTYTLTDNICSTTDDITITVNPLPTVGANSDDIDNMICYGDTITLTGSGANSYTWDNGIIDGIGFVPTTTQTYTVTGTTSAGCSNTDTIEITVNPLPNIDSLVTTDVTVCSTPYNGSVTVYVSGSGGYNYSFNNGSFISQNYLDTLGAGVVTVTVVDTNGCQASDSETIGTNNNLSIDSVYVTDVLCHGDSSGIITIDAPDANQFSIDNGATFDTSYTFTGLPAGNYNIMVLDSGNCQAFDAITINEPTAIQLTSNVTDYACGQLGEASVQATGGTLPYSYLWSTGDTTSDITGLQPDTFYVTVTDDYGCSESLTVIVSNSGGTAQIQTTTTDVLCNGFADGTATAVMTNGSAPYTYQWNMGDSTSTVTGLAAGTYYVTIVDAVGCTGNDTVTISEPPALDVTNQTTDVSCYGYNNGSISINATGGTPGYSYHWNTGDSTATISNLGSGYYSVTVTDTNACSTNIDSIYIIEPDSLYINLINATSPLCYNGNDGAISVTGIGGTPPYSYTWNIEDSTETLNNLTAGIYFLTLTDINHCQDTTTITLTNPEEMTITADYGVDSILYQGYINLNITGGTQPYSYEWSNAATSQNLSGLSSGNYLVTITDFKGCAQTDSFNIEIPLIIPTIITPNGDSYNDTWQITNIESYKDVHIEIYDRWGDIIFTFDGTGLEYTDPENQWDGTYNGKKLPFTSYVYIVTLNNNEQVYNGVVTIKR